jgi:hypothetical protein
VKKYLFLLSLLLSYQNFYGQLPAIAWEKSYGGTKGDAVYDMCATRDGRIALCGSTASNDYDVSCSLVPVSWTNAWIFCVDTNSTLLWSKCYGGTYEDDAMAIDTTSDGGFIVVAYTASTDGDVVGNHSNNADYWVLKLDSVGNIEWSKCYGGSNSDLPSDIAPTSDHGYIINGYSRSVDGDVVGSHSDGFYYFDYWVVKIDSAGIIQWQKPLGGFEDDRGFTALEFSKNKYLVGGIANSNDGDVTLPIQGGDFWIVMLDSAGNIISNHSYGGGGADQCRQLLKTRDEKIILGGPTDSNNFEITDAHGGEDYLLVEIDSVGNFLWAHSYGGTGEEYLRSMTLTSDTGIAAIGMSQNSAGTGQVSENYGDDDYWVIKTDKLGNLKWEKNFGGSDEDQGQAICVRGNNIFISGWSGSSDDDVTYNHDPGGGDGWTAMLEDYNSTFDPQLQTLSFSLFPDPSSSYVNIVYSNKKNATLSFMDAYGRVVKQLSLNPSFEEMLISINDLDEGIYLVTLCEADRRFSIKEVIHR